jgi:hypothetical protein
MPRHQHTLRQHWDELQAQRMRFCASDAAALSKLAEPRSEVMGTPTEALAAVRKLARDVRPERMRVLVRVSASQQ